VWSVGRRLFRGVRPWVRTWYEAWGVAGVSGAGAQELRVLGRGPRFGGGAGFRGWSPGAGVLGVGRGLGSGPESV
jgi:hypothetical protein